MQSANRSDSLRARLLGEEGSSALEFLTAGLILLVPLVYLALAVSTIQSASLAAEGSARYAARVYSLSDSPAEARQRAHRAINMGLRDFGLRRDSADVDIACSPDAAACLTPGGRIDVTVTVRAPLPLIPDVLAPGGRASIAVSGQASQQVSRFGVAP